MSLVSDLPVQTTTPDWLPGRAAWADFLTSPGFAGVMAVAAASIAGFFVSRQLRQARRKHADERWWESLKWTYDLIVGEESTNTGSEVALSLLLALQQEADDKHGTKLQRSTIGALAAVFTSAPETALAQSVNPLDNEGVDDAPGSQTESALSAESHPPALPTTGQLGRNLTDFSASGSGRVAISPDASDSLRSLLENAKDSSPQARAALYEMAIYDALLAVAPTIDIARPTRESGYDLAVESWRGRIGVEMKMWSRIPSLSVIERSLAPLHRAVDAGEISGAVLVVPAPTSASEKQRLQEIQSSLPSNIIAFGWDGQDAAALYQAIESAGDVAFAFDMGPYQTSKGVDQIARTINEVGQDKRFMGAIRRFGVKASTSSGNAIYEPFSPAVDGGRDSGTDGLKPDWRGGWRWNLPLTSVSGASLNHGWQVVFDVYENGTLRSVVARVEGTSSRREATRFVDSVLKLL